METPHLFVAIDTEWGLNRWGYGPDGHITEFGAADAEDTVLVTDLQPPIPSAGRERTALGIGGCRSVTRTVSSPPFNPVCGRWQGTFWVGTKLEKQSSVTPCNHTESFATTMNLLTT